MDMSYVLNFIMGATVVCGLAALAVILGRRKAAKELEERKANELREQ